MMKRLLVLLVQIPALTMAQDLNNVQNRISPKEFSIPASPVFDVMGVTPSQVNRTSDIKDFKVDWSFKSWKLNPNLALQSQPIWEILYNRKDLKKYQSASPFARKLATLDISAGTITDENADRRIGAAAKINLLRQRDPLMARDLYAGIDEKYRQERTDLETQLKVLRKQLDTTSNILEKPGIRQQIAGLEDQLMSQNHRRRDEINARAKIYVEEYWNASSLDMAAGQVYTYAVDSAGHIGSLRLNKNTGFSWWLNGSLGIGKHLLLSGLTRSTWYDEQINFNVKDNSTGELTSKQAVARNTLFSFGFNLRYGSPLYTFFVEMLYERKRFSTVQEALDLVFKAPPGTTVDGGSLKWTAINPNNITIGGDWRLSRSVILNYGLRASFDKNWKFTQFVPVATISCMMR